MPAINVVNVRVQKEFVIKGTQRLAGDVQHLQPHRRQDRDRRRPESPAGLLAGKLAPSAEPSSASACATFSDHATSVCTTVVRSARGRLLVRATARQVRRPADQRRRDRRRRQGPDGTESHRDDFVIEEDGQPQTIESLLPSADLPVSIGVVLDASKSMESKIRTAQRAIDRFLSMIHQDDEIFLMTFAMRASLIADFTSDRTTLTNALLSGVNLSGGTSLYDSLYQALQKVQQGRYRQEGRVCSSPTAKTPRA
jgi:Mg-chelatase subunit ChlD